MPKIDIAALLQTDYDMPTNRYIVFIDIYDYKDICTVSKDKYGYK